MHSWIMAVYGTGFDSWKGFLGDRVSHRQEKYDDKWWKSVMYSPNVFQSCLHIPVGCQVSGMFDFSWPGDTEGAFLLDEGVMSVNHYRDIITFRGGVEAGPDPGEYAQFWSELNKRVMCFLFEQNMPSKDWYIEISNKHYKQKSNPKNADKTLEYDCTMVSPQKPFSFGGYVENIQ